MCAGEARREASHMHHDDLVPCALPHCELPTQAGLCEDHADSLRRDLYELPELYEALTLYPGRTDSERISGSRDQPIGLRVDVLSFTGPALRDDQPQRLDVGEPDLQTGPLPLHDVLRQWGRIICTDRDLNPGLVDAQRFHLQNLDWSTAQAWADDYYLELRAAIHVCRVLSGAGHLTHHLTGVACPRLGCNLQTLVRENGSEEVRCRSCRATWTWDEYQWLTRLLVSQLPKAS